MVVPLLTCSVHVFMRQRGFKKDGRVSNEITSLNFISFCFHCKFLLKTLIPGELIMWRHWPGVHVALHQAHGLLTAVELLLNRQSEQNNMPMCLSFLKRGEEAGDGYLFALCEARSFRFPNHHHPSIY